jgi:hypothetical protein
MPAPNIEQIKKFEASIKKAVAEQGDSSEPVKRRGAKKQLRRIQRKRRLAVAQAAKHAPKPKAEAPAAAAAEAPAEEASAE